jgi:signal transduction histidine kinase
MCHDDPSTSHEPTSPESQWGFSELAQYLARRQDAQISRWAEAVRNDPAIPATDSLADPQLIDHIPHLLRDMVQMLRQSSLLVIQQVREDSHAHGDFRWEQHYELSELLREFTWLRAILMEDLVSFEDQAPRERRAAVNAVRSVIHRFLDDAARRSCVSFVAKHSAEIRGLADSRLRLLRGVSHELRNAINPVAMIAHSMRLGGDLASLHTHAATLDTVVRHMREVVEELLDFSQIAEGKSALSQGLFSPAELVRDWISFVNAACENKGLALNVHLDPSVPNLFGDVHKIRQIGNNLLNNAIKFTECGEIHLAVSVVDSQRWSITVRDTGMGIAEAEQSHIFEEFYRAPGTENIAGTGVGLALTKKLVDLLGGTIRFHSKPGEGSQFTVTLPIAETVSKQR